MSGIFNIGGSTGSSSLLDTYFGTNSGNSNNNNTSDVLSSSLISSASDLAMIKRGTYKTALKAYYASVAKDDKESISGSGAADSKQTLSTLKSNAGALADKASSIKKKNYFSEDGTTLDKDKLYSDLEGFVKEYNETLGSTKKLNSYSMLQTAVWMTENTNSSEAMLEKVGITIGEDNTLKIDKDAFEKADSSVVKSLFSGSNSYIDRVAQKASSLKNQSASQMAINSGNYLYTRQGTY